MEKFRQFETSLATKFVACGLGIAALAGCSSPEIEPDKPATVLEHIHHSAYTSFVPAGKGVLVPIYHPERFNLNLWQCNRSQDADSQGCVTLEIQVSRETYDSYPDGSTIVFPSEPVN